MNERPLINDTPGQPPHPMTDEQYEDYLSMKEEISKFPPPPHEPTVAELAQLLEQERKRGDQLQQQIDTLLEGRTGA